MSSKYIQEGRVLDHTPGSAVSKDQVVVMGVRVGVALNDIASGATGPVAVEGVFELTKLTSDNVAQGALLYWDAGNSRLTLTSTSNTLAGFAVEAAGTSASVVKIKLNA